jgi:hypothetical protein
VEYIQQCKIKFEPPKHKMDIAQFANCQRYGHTKNHCHLKPRCIKCAANHLTIQCHRKERLNDVPCVLCGGNHPANYKGCLIYKDLKKKYTPPSIPKSIIHLHKSNKPYTLSQVYLNAQIRKNLYTPPLHNRTDTTNSISDKRSPRKQTVLFCSILRHHTSIR